MCVGINRKIGDIFRLLLIFIIRRNYRYIEKGKTSMFQINFIIIITIIICL